MLFASLVCPEDGPYKPRKRPSVQKQQLLVHQHHCTDFTSIFSKFTCKAMHALHIYHDTLKLKKAQTF
jgi:hypothetical protein